MVDVLPTLNFDVLAAKMRRCERGFRRDLSLGSLGAAAPLPPLPKSSPVRAVWMSMSTVRRLFVA